MSHPLARCCWCGAAFVQATVEGASCWICATPSCQQRCLDNAMLVAVKGKGRRCRFVPLPRQVEAIEAVLGAPTYILIGGAAGGSKSRGVREIAHRMCLAVDGYRVLLLRRTFRELDQTHLRDVETEAPEMGAQAVPSAKVVRYPNGSVLQFGHCETSADAANYLSAEYDLIIFDELVTFELSQFLLISSRARSTKKGVQPKVLCGTNPGGPQSHWVRSRFIDKAVDRDEYPDYDPADWLFIPSKLEDNPYLDDNYERKLKMLPPELRRAYRDGDWDIFPGQYFPEWRRAKHVSQEHICYPPEYRRVIGMDWGFVKPGYIGWFVLLPEGGAYLEHEYVPTRVTASEQGKEMGRRSVELGYKGVAQLVYDYQMDTPGTDSGEPIIESVLRGIRQSGAKVSPVKADKDRLNGWARFRQWLGDSPAGVPWLTVSPTCTYFARTIPAQVSDEHNPEDLDTDGEDHAADVGRYFVMARPAAAGMKAERTFAPGTLGWYKRQQDTGRRGVLARA